jgi:hypothetical protein
MGPLNNYKMRPYLADITISKLPKAEDRIQNITNKFIIEKKRVVIFGLNKENVIYKNEDNEIIIEQTKNIEKMEFIKYE